MSNTFRKEYRPLSDDEKQRVENIKNCAAVLEDAFDVSLGGGREMALARTKLEEAVMWAVKSITT